MFDRLSRLFKHPAIKADPVVDAKQSVHPEQPNQNPNLSIVDASGRYDMTRFSKHERDVISQILKVVNSGKYPPGLKAVGLASEASVISYKPRYILYEIIIQVYARSEKPLDLLAVGEAYRSQGAAFYSEALSFLERYVTTASASDRRTAEKYLFDSRDPFLSYHIAELLEKLGEYDRALVYALKAKDVDNGQAPAFVQKVGDIYRKMDPQLAIDFYNEILRTKMYAKYAGGFREELAKAVAAQSKRPYKRRGYKPPADTIEFHKAVSAAAKAFLPGGKYYDESFGLKID